MHSTPARDERWSTHNNTGLPFLATLLLLCSFLLIKFLETDCPGTDVNDLRGELNRRRPALFRNVHGIEVDLRRHRWGSVWSESLAGEHDRTQSRDAHKKGIRRKADVAWLAGDKFVFLGRVERNRQRSRRHGNHYWTRHTYLHFERMRPICSWGPSGDLS